MKKLLLFLMMASLPLVAGAQAQYELKRDVPYVSPDDTSTYRRERCVLDIYYPVSQKKFKTIVWFHGGALEGGQKEIREELKRAGFAVVAPNYRLYPRGRCPSYIEDAAAAVAWVVRHIGDYGGDASQVYVGGHSAGGYLTLMLCLDKRWLEACHVDADSIRGYFPVGGQCATHYTIRKERGLPFSIPFVDGYAPLNHARKLRTQLVLFTGQREREQMARYEENSYLKAALEGVGNANIPLYELNGFDHGNAVRPACLLIRDLMGGQPLP